MYEIRFRIDSEEALLRRIDQFQAIKIKEFLFNDTYYVPDEADEDWKTGLTTVRFRKFADTSQLLFSRYKIIKIQQLSFVENRFKSKIVLIENNDEMAAEFIDCMGLRKVATIKRESGAVYEVKINENDSIQFTIEKISDYGLSSEIELPAEYFQSDQLSTNMGLFMEMFNANPIHYPLFGDFIFRNSLFLQQ